MSRSDLREHNRRLSFPTDVVGIAAAILLALASIAGVASRPAPAGSRPIPVYRYEIVNSWPHDPTAFTQGLVWGNGALLESTGLRGASSLRVVDLRTGAVKRKVDLPPRYFAEGLTLFKDRLFQLTWDSNRGFVYDAKTLKRLGTFSYDGEGWGLTNDGRFLIMSDGTAVLRFLDPGTFRVVRAVGVHENGAPLTGLNELEYIKGQIYANVWQRDVIARIDPQTGAISGWIDLTGLAPPQRDPAAVLNGIAYDPAGERLFVTGKLWPTLYEIRVQAP